MNQELSYIYVAMLNIMDIAHNKTNLLYGFLLNHHEIPEIKINNIAEKVPIYTIRVLV